MGGFYNSKCQMHYYCRGPGGMPFENLLENHTKKLAFSWFLEQVLGSCSHRFFIKLKMV